MTIVDADILTVAMLFLAYGLLTYLGTTSRSGPAFKMCAGFVAIALAVELYTLTTDYVLTGVFLIVAIATLIDAIREVV